MAIELGGRVIRQGDATGEALCSSVPISFYGGVDLERGEVNEAGHPLEGRSFVGRILVFPAGKGSTVGSWALLRLARRGLGPAALICRECETIVAVGAILAEIPCVDRIDIERLRTGQRVSVAGSRVIVED
jgi:predicted aconitase with swiveling domain